MSHRNPLLAALMVGAMASGCGEVSRAGAPPHPPAVVTVQPVIQQDVPISAEWVGTLTGYINAQIRPRVSGHLVSQAYREGALIRAGDPMFQVDPRPYQTAVDQAQARLLQAEAQLNQARAQIGAHEAQVEQAVATVAGDDAKVAQAEADQRRTELDVARYAPLAQRGSVSQRELDNAVQNNKANLAAVDAARAAVRNARATVANARATLERAHAEVQTREAGVTAARAALADARLNLSYTRVVAPISGMAGFRVANIGDYVGPNDPAPLTTVSQVDPIYAEFPIGEQQALELFRRLEREPTAPREVEVELILADGSLYPHRGRAVALDRQVDLRTGTVLVRGVFANPGHVLRPGQYAKVRAVTEVRTGALLIPQRAVQDVQGMPQVAVLRPDDSVDVRAIKTGPRVGRLWVVTAGLTAGERVVVEGAERVRPGQKVQLAAPAAAGR